MKKSNHLLSQILKNIKNKILNERINLNSQKLKNTKDQGYNRQPQIEKMLEHLIKGPLIIAFSGDEIFPSSGYFDVR